MTTTTMHFGPEWMRTKHQAPSRPSVPPSPPPTSGAPPTASTYSALVSPVPPPQPEKHDETHPFRYTREDMLRIYREGGGKGGLGLEVERWEGVVREVGSEPVALREWGDREKKLFAGPLNSELRRRQSSDLLSPLVTASHSGDRPRMNHNTSGTGSPMRERFGGLIGRRKDPSDQPAPRKSSLSGGLPSTSSPREALPGPRTRVGFGPNFDGVLNGGDSWIARRKASENFLKAGVSQVGEEHHKDGKCMDANEEETDTEQVENVMQHSQGTLSTDPPDGHAMDFSAADMFINSQSSAPQSTSNPSVKSSASSLPTIQDLNSVEWSYLDPQGQVQGPFRADLMQKWYNDGYFSPDLLMKRTHIDMDWTPLGELGHRAYGENIFLSPPSSCPLPPGLTKRTESPPRTISMSSEQHTYKVPCQPVPSKSLRNATLDSFIASTSNPSDSPSSSFSIGRFGSPDPSAYGGRAGVSPHPIGEPAVGNRVGPFSNIPDVQTSFTNARRNTLHEVSTEHSVRRLPSYGNVAASGGSSSNLVGSGFETPPNSRNTEDMAAVSSGFGMPISNFGSKLPRQQHTVCFSNDGGVPSPTLRDSSASAAFSSNEYNSLSGDAQPLNRSVTDDSIIGTPGFSYSNGLVETPFTVSGQNQQYSPSPPLHYVTPRPGPSNTNFNGQLPSSILTSPNRTQAPWDNQDLSIRRPGPFEPHHPTANNVIPTNNAVRRPTTPSQPAPWGRTSQNSHSGSHHEPSPWYTASQNAPDDTWKDVTAPTTMETPGPDSLTFRNVGQHNQQQRQQHEFDAPVSSSSAVQIPATSEFEVPRPSAVEPVGSAPPIQDEVQVAPLPTTGKSRKATISQVQTSSVQIPSVASGSTQAKPAWSKEDETGQTKPSGLSIGLREIQEAETKKAEARKAAERERERSVRNAPSPSVGYDEAQPFTASWGLPTSQAGSARNPASQKESLSTSSSGPASSNAPVWTNNGKPPPKKKTMKEIQEEEERQKRVAVKETTAAAARRAYAESTNKTSSVSSIGGAWTTVGGSGKPSLAISTTARPAITPSSSAQSVSGSPAARVNGTTPPRHATTPAVKGSPRSTKEDHSSSPSHEFLKWLSDSLKGLNSSVNVEEIMSMLLSFPMDPDSSTVEIISDLIYANSTTLDGRRFASEFVNRRKADVSSRPKGGAAGDASGKSVSIADVVKAQPKPTQPGWGGFKVVNKKKKGGRT